MDALMQLSAAKKTANADTTTGTPSTTAQLRSTATSTAAARAALTRWRLALPSPEDTQDTTF